MDTKRATSREVQRSIFTDSLFKELEMMEKSAESRNATLAARALQYCDEGLVPDEVVDMLILDGFPSELSRTYVSMGMGKEASADPGTQWDFLYEDANGRIWRGSQLGITVAGATRDEAIAAARILVESRDIRLERIIDAEQIEKQPE